MKYREEYPIIRRRGVRKKPVRPGRLIASILLFFAGGLAAAYGLFVRMANSGTGFYLVWIGLGALFLLLGLFTAAGWWSRVPKAVKIILLAVLASGLVLIAVTWSRIVPHFSDRGKAGADAVIVLGAQVRSTGPSTILKYRLNAAASYLKENPDAVCIVSGAKGKNEPFTEAQGMKEYLVEQGIPGKNILLEEKAENTAENLAYSRKLLPSEDASVVLVTNNFHVYRALALAKKQGYSDVSGLAAGSPKLYLPNNMLYESAAVLKNRLTGAMD